MKRGLKLWSDNGWYAGKAGELYSDGIYEYIELYCVPGTYEDYIRTWESLKIPYIIHAPHSSHGLNMADMKKKELNMALYTESRRFADTLESPYIIIHPGIMGGHSSVIEQFNMIRDERILIENKPYLAMNKKDICAGSVPEEISSYLADTGAGFCLDINHAFTAAKHKNVDFMEMLDLFTGLKPSVVHICGIDSRFDVDNHIHMWEGDIPMDEVVDKVISSGAEFWTLETPKDSRSDLDDFLEDVKFFEGLLKERS